MDWLLAAIAVIAIVGYKFIINRYYASKAAKAEQRYMDAFESVNETTISNYEEIRQLVLRAGIPDVYIQTTKHVIGATFKAYSVSALRNIAVKSSEVGHAICSMLEKAKSTYDYRAKQALNPAYWIELVILAPIKLLKYVGFNDEKTAVKLAGVVLNILWILLATTFAFFRDDILGWLKGLLVDVTP